MFTVYSIGDIDFLSTILNGVAMMSGSGSVSKMVSIGLLIAVLIVAVESIFRGAKEINWQHVLIGWLMYAVMFGPTATVVVEDAYSGQARPVANIPIGIAFAGSTVSEIGYGITKLFETAYGAFDGITEDRYNEPLKALNAVRNGAYDSSVFTALNAANGGGSVDVRRSWTDYINACTLSKVDKGLAKTDDIFNQDVFTALRYDSVVDGVQLFLTPGSPEGQFYTCQDAWTPLTAALNRVTSAPVVAVLSRLIGKTAAPGGGGSGLTDVDNALHSLGAVAASGSEFVKVSILEPLYYEAAKGHYLNLHDYTSALMVNQAIQQRNTQWAAQQSMFMTVVRPVMAFFEGFVYAITPLAAFLIVLGAMGMSLVGRYIQSLLWIQLWLPVLSICNLFILTSTEGKVSQLATTYPDLTSFYALNSMGDILQNWIATGGMMAAATPMISLFIISGSTYAFTKLAGNIGGQDHIDEKLNSPDLLARGPLLQQAPDNKGNTMNPMERTGFESTTPYIQYGAMAKASAQSAHQVAEGNQQAFAHQLGQGYEEAVQKGQTSSYLSEIGRTIGASHTTGARAVQDQAQAFMDKFGVDNSHQQQVQGIFALQASGAIDPVKAGAQLAGLMAGAAAGPGGAAAGAAIAGKMADKLPGHIEGRMTGEGRTTTSDAYNHNKQQAIDFLHNAGFSKTDGASVDNTLAEHYAGHHSDSFSSTLGNKATEQLTQTAQKVLSSNDTYTRAADKADSFGTNARSKPEDLAARINETPGAATPLAEYFRYRSTPQERSRANALAHKYESQGHMTPAIAQTAAQLVTLSQPGSDIPTDQQQAGREAALATITRATTGGPLSIGDAGENAGLKAPASVDVSRIKTATDGAAGTGLRDPSAVRAEARNSDINHLGRNIPSDAQGTAVPAQAAANEAQVSQTARANTAAVTEPARRAAEQELLHPADQSSKAVAMRGLAMRMAQGIPDGISQLGTYAVAGAAGSSAAAGAFDQVTSQLKTMTPAQLEQFRADVAQGKDQVLADFPTMGPALATAADGGNAILGAAAMGVQMVKQGLTGEQQMSQAAQGMSLSERGAFYASALAQADAAGGAAFQSYVDQNGDKLAHVMEQVGTQRYGLTPSQARVFASSYAWTPGYSDQAENDIRNQYANNPELGNAVIDRLSTAGKYGDAAGSYIIPVQQLDSVQQARQGAGR